MIVGSFRPAPRRVLGRGLWSSVSPAGTSQALDASFRLSIGSCIAQMDVNELVAAMEVAAINEHEGFVRGGPERIKLQHKWVAVYNEICEEIQSRGHEALQHHVPLLAAEHPAVRLAAALGLLKTAPHLAVPVLEDLRVGKYGGGIASDAGMTLDAMRRSGEIP